MTHEQIKVLRFHLATGLPIRPFPEFHPEDAGLRAALLEEEMEELHEAQDERDIIKIADALGDLLYVVYGTAITYGIDLEPIFDEIHRSNMSKVRGGVIRRADGKILKGPHYFPPNLADEIAGQK